jgi:hypothetical protein
MALILQLSKDHLFFPEIDQILTQIESIDPNLAMIGFWLGIPTKGICRCKFSRDKNGWKCLAGTVYYEFHDLHVVNMPQLHGNQSGGLPMRYDPPDQYNEISLDGDHFQWQDDKALQQFFNRKCGKRHPYWVKNAGILPMISAIWEGNSCYLYIYTMSVDPKDLKTWHTKASTLANILCSA